MAERLVVACDVDGTLIDSSGADIDNPFEMAEVGIPITANCAAVKKMSEYHDIVAVTGRTHVLRDTTMKQFHAVGLPLERLYLQRTWEGWEAYVTFKAEVFKSIGADVAIGDTYYDEQAANLAGCRFIHANDLPFVNPETLESNTP